MAEKTYDAIVIGGGPGGYPCAIRLGQLKQKVLCIEKDEVGGVCLNWGCVPSKAIIATSHTYEKVKTGAAYGLMVDNARIDANKMQDWKEGIVKKLTGGVRTLFKGNGVELLYGEARVTGPKTVDGEDPRGDDRGHRGHQGDRRSPPASTTIEIPSFKFDGKQIIGAKEAVSLREIPQAPARHRRRHHRHGARGRLPASSAATLTVVEALPNVLTGVDPDVAAVVERRYTKHGAKILKGAKALGYERQRDGSIAVRVDVGGQDRDDRDRRRSRRRGHAPERRGPRPRGARRQGRARLRPDRRRGQTNVPGHLRHRRLLEPADARAQGDERGRGRRRGDRRATRPRRTGSPSRRPSSPIRRSPPWASASSRRRRRASRSASASSPSALSVEPWPSTRPTASSRSSPTRRRKEILGVHIVGPEATDLISEGALALEMHAFLEDVGLTIHPHPTLGEGMMEASLHALGQAIHVMNREPR